MKTLSERIKLIVDENTRLVKINTELLAALEDLVNTMESHGFPFDPQVTISRAAIAKAKGE